MAIGDAINPHSKHGWDKSIIRMNAHIKAAMQGNHPDGSILQCGEFTPHQLIILRAFVNSFREETCEDEDVS